MVKYDEGQGFLKFNPGFELQNSGIQDSRFQGKVSRDLES